MAGIEDITPNVEVEGAGEAADQLTNLGDKGAEAFDKIGEAADAAGAHLGAIEAMAKRAGTSYEEMATRVANASKAFSGGDKGGGGLGEGIEKGVEGGEKAFGDLATVAAESFAKIMEAAGSGNFVGLITLGFGKMAGAIAEVVQKATEFVEAQAQMIESLDNLAHATGMSLGQIEGLKDAFASVGISANGFERAIGRLAITIGNQWSQILQAVRTSGDAQTGAMLHVEQSALNVSKAYHEMSAALTHASQEAAHDALHIEEAALTLKKAAVALEDFSISSRQNSLSLESAQLGLQRARMNLAKDQGFTVSAADERRLKISQDMIAVKEAELKLEEANNKKKREGMELELLTLNLKKAQQEKIDAANKQQEDAIKTADKLKDAHLGIDKAQLARNESMEKMHQQELTNIPKIVREVEEVAAGHKKWDDVMNHAEITANTLTKAIIKAASGGDGQPPRAMEVFTEMSKLFAHMGDSADAMNKQLEIVQHTMGAGFRAGQASAVQMLAVLRRGPEELKKFMDEAEKFAQVKLGGFDLKESAKSLIEFNSEFARLEAAIDQVKNRFAAIMSVPLAEFFKSIREAIYDDESTLRKFIESAASGFKIVVDAISTAVKAIAGNTLFQRLVEGVGQLLGLIFDLAKGFAQLASEFNRIAGVDMSSIFKVAAVAVDLLSAAMVGLKIAIGTVLLGLGALAAGYDRVFGKAKSWEDALKNSPLYQTGSQMLESAKGDTDRVSKNLGNDAAALLKGAATKEDEAATKGIASADKLGQSGEKLDTAGQTQTQAAGSLAQAGQSISTNLNGSADSLKGAAAALTDAAATFKSALASMAKSMPAGMATGGQVSGPGGPTDDKAGLFALSDGEYVVRGAAVQHYGAPLFEALNNLAVGGFATGGIVGARAPSIPSGTGAGPSSVLNLTIDGQHFDGLRAPEHVASKLKTYAVTRQSSSAGRTPSWMR